MELQNLLQLKLKQLEKKENLKLQDINSLSNKISSSIKNSTMIILNNMKQLADNK